MSILKKAAVAAAALFIATSAHSATVSSDLSLGYKSGTYNAGFDINSEWNGTDKITSAVLTAYLRDDRDRQYSGSSRIRYQSGTRRVQTGYQYYSCGSPFRPRTCRRPVYRTVPVYSYRTIYHYHDERETAQLIAGSQSDSDATSYYSTSSGSTRVSGYTGNMFLQIALDANGMADLMDDGRLSAQLRLFGDAILTRLQLDFESEPMSDVPLPASALLLLGGMGGLAVMRRRKRA